ncbi:hypothetical protein CO046_01555 [Candidatus Peregrinibacteria bacterium CG_4_9_14_0_2_um_filter_53_11]|nr:MAG: hypothetical protein CO046_01555 [Candidatus Peregrinibacteria bacterium CG_4_9_14_0_2_um_filter_53_11]
MEQPAEQLPVQLERPAEHLPQTPPRLDELADGAREATRLLREKTEAQPEQAPQLSARAGEALGRFGENLSEATKGREAVAAATLARLRQLTGKEYKAEVVDHTSEQLALGVAQKMKEGGPAGAADVGTLASVLEVAQVVAQQHEAMSAAIAATTDGAKNVHRGHVDERA